MKIRFQGYQVLLMLLLTAC